MKKISLVDLSSSIHGGENFAFTKELNVFGCHIPYLNGKAFKKVAEKFFDTGLMATAVGAIGYQCLTTEKKNTDTFKTACAFVGGTLVLALLKGAVEDFVIDQAYDYFDLDKG